MRFYTCSECGQVFTGSLSGENFCPQCRRPVKRRSEEPFFTVEQVRQHVLIRIRGGSYRIGDLAQLKAALEKADSGHPKSVAFLFDGDSVLDSGFLNLMARTVYQQSKAGSVVFVAAQNPHMLESLQILGLDRVVQIVADEKAYGAAIEAMDAPGQGHF